MKVLVLTNMYPTVEQPAFGVFVEDQVESLRRQGIDVDVLLVNGRKSKLEYLKGYFRFWKQLWKNKYDVIHAHYVYSGLIARAQRKVPVLLTHHGPEVFWGGQGWISRRITKWFQQVIVVSEEMRSRLPYPKAHVIPCGVDMDRFQPMDRNEARERLGLPLDKKLVLWAGEYYRPEKRFELVEQAVEIMKQRDPAVELVLLSGKPHKDVPAYMNACDVLFLVSDGEGSPMVVKEAMACNLPVIGTAVGDIPDVIGEIDGCYVVSQDPEEIAQKAMLSLAREARAAGREAVQRMSIDSIARDIVAIYEQMTAQKVGAVGKAQAGQE